MKISFLHNNKEISFNIIYRKRKTMSLEIKPNGLVNVLAPLGYDKNFIIDSVKNKADWILKNLEEIESKNKFDRTYEDGDKFIYLGKEYVLQVITDKSLIRPSVNLEDKNLVVKLNSNNKELIKHILKTWYCDKTLEIVKDRIDFYKKFFKYSVSSIKIKDQKTRWASCTYKNEILFNLRCSMAPLEVVDYIVVHEMCHMEHRNHSKDFYNAVEKILPNYKIRIKWLKDNGIKMNF